MKIFQIQIKSTFCALCEQFLECLLLKDSGQKVSLCLAGISFSRLTWIIMEGQDLVSSMNEGTIKW